MKILWLGPERQRLLDYVALEGDSVLRTEDPLSPDDPLLTSIDWIVSYGYRHLIREWLIERFPRRIINLHISLLPWNRGADPNLWSFLEDTLKGVTIHYIDAGIDTGDILVQQELCFGPDETLKSSYEKLSSAMEDLFMKNWGKIRQEQLPAFAQTGEGSFHRMKDKAAFEHLLSNGWDTPVGNLIGKALVLQES